jgi:hypothetical protein
MTETFDVGDGIRATASFALEGVPTDPTTTTAQVRHPDGVVDDATAGLVHDGDGEYHLDLVPDASGVWVVRIAGSGVVAAAMESAYEVRPEGVEGLGIASYGGDPAMSDTDRLRLLIGDTRSPFALSDPEVAVFAGVDSDMRIGASQAALALSARFAAMVDRTVGDLSVSYSQRSKAFSQLAKDLRSAAASGLGGANGAIVPGPYAGGLRRSDMIGRDPDLVRPYFDDAPGGTLPAMAAVAPAGDERAWWGW